MEKQEYIEISLVQTNTWAEIRKPGSNFAPRCHCTRGNPPVRTKDQCIENVEFTIIKLKTYCHCILNTH